MCENVQFEAIMMKKVEDDDDDETTTTATETTHTHATGLKWERESERMQFLLQLLIEVRS